MSSSWPQYTIIALYLLNVIGTAILDGKPKTGNYSAGVAMTATAISAWLLWCGGFWEPVLK